MQSAETAAAEGPGRIGPNAIIRTIEAIEAFEGRSAAVRVLRDAGIQRYLDSPPAAMVDETEVARLTQSLYAAFPEQHAHAIGWIAGRRTADYLLANRIPIPFRHLVRVMPDRIASRLLMLAIGLHAWTFVGSGRFAVSFSTGGTRLEVAHSPLCRALRTNHPACGFYEGTFERLYAALVHPGAKVVERRCCAAGDGVCAFDLSWT